MFFLIRCGFWLSVLLLVLPLGLDGKNEGPSASDRKAIDAMAALAAAGATVSDVGGFCARQPGACDVGQQAIAIVGERARNGASAIGEYFARDGKPAAAAPATTGATANPVSRGTLTAADRKPAWRVPGA